MESINLFYYFCGMKSDIKRLEFTALADATLLAFLYSNITDKSKTTVKSYLANRQVSVNDVVITQFDQPIKPGDKVVVSFGRQKESLRHPLLKLIYEDDEILVVNKSYGLLSIATDKERDRTAYKIVSDYLKREDPKALVFIVHRLDRETSGVMLFAKTEEVQQKLQLNWNENVLERKYYAVVEGIIEQEEGIIESYLTESKKSLKVYATTKEEGKLATTAFKVLKTNKENTLLELQLETGRKNQIRAHLEYVGFPIIGDKKYGAKTNPIGRVALHAGSIVFAHPSEGRTMSFETPVPASFTNLFDKRKKYFAHAKGPKNSSEQK